MVGSGVVTVADGAWVGWAWAAWRALLFGEVGGVGGGDLLGGEHGGERWLDDAPGWGARWLARWALAGGGGAGWRLTHGKALLDEQAPPPGGDGMSGG